MAEIDTIIVDATVDWPLSDEAMTILSALLRSHVTCVFLIPPGDTMAFRLALPSETPWDVTLIECENVALGLKEMISEINNFAVRVGAATIHSFTTRTVGMTSTDMNAAVMQKYNVATMV